MDNAQSMIVLFSDFGLTGPYTGQMKAVLHRDAPGHPVIDLFADAPAHDPMRAAYLLAAYAGEFPEETVFLCVVDPGVGGTRKPLVVEVGKRWFIGPGNGLFELLIRRAANVVSCWEITWRPERMSASFHGRDLFAPTAAKIARCERPPGSPGYEPLVPDEIRCPEWPDDLAEIIYIDEFGNAMTGMRAESVPKSSGLMLDGVSIPRAETFSSVSPGEMFCYENANGLLEIAVNKGRAADQQGVGLGKRVVVGEL